MEQNVKDKIKLYSEKYNIPTWVLSSIIQVESGFNPNVVGDNGTSFGLYQLHWGGQGTINGVNMPPSYLKDIDNNLRIGTPPIASAYRSAVSKGLQGYGLLEYVAGHSGHPSYTGAFTTNYQSMLKRAYQDGDEVGNGSLPYPYKIPTNYTPNNPNSPVIDNNTYNSSGITLPQFNEVNNGAFSLFFELEEAEKLKPFKLTNIDDNIRGVAVRGVVIWIGLLLLITGLAIIVADVML